jgi:LuxR family maltose regulon positive regulatory protein
MARLREAEGDLGAAGDLLDEAVRVYVGDYSPNVRPVPAQRARMDVLTGDLPGARKWADMRGLSASDELTYLSEYEHLTLARIHLAEYRLEGSETALTVARELLDRLLAAAEAGGRTGTVIEVLTLLGLAHQAQGDLDAARDAVDRALRLAEPEGYARVFLDEGPAIRTLLLGVAENRADWPYLRRLLDRSPRPDAARPPLVSAVGQGLVDPLSQRELDVLRLLASDLDGPAIARELVVSLNTVRTHTKHIYAKLGVNSRRSAVSQAHQRGLLSGNR